MSATNLQVYIINYSRLIISMLCFLHKRIPQAFVILYFLGFFFMFAKMYITKINSHRFAYLGKTQNAVKRRERMG